MSNNKDNRRILSGAVWKTKEYEVVDHAENKVYKVIERSQDHKVVDLRNPDAVNKLLTDLRTLNANLPTQEKTLVHKAKLLKRNKNEIKKFAQIMDGDSEI